MKYIKIISFIVLSILSLNCSSDDPPPPEVEFSYQVNGVEVAFTSHSNNTNSLSWDFGDGKTSTQGNPVHIYEKSGTFTVRLTAIGDGGTVSATNTIEVFEAPVVDFSIEVNGKQVSFTSQVSNTNSLSWDFGDGNTSTEANPVHTYESSGNYDVKLSATGEGGSDSITKSVKIFEAPVVDFSIEVNGKQVSFTSQVSNSNSLSWDFGDGNTSAEANPVHTYESSGNYDVKLSATGEGGSASVIKTVEIKQKPTAGFSLSDPEPVQWDIVTIISNPIAADDIVYTVTGGIYVLDGISTIQFLEEKTYTVTQTVTNVDGTDILSIDVAVDAPDNKYTLDGSDLPVSGNAYWYDATAMGGIVHLRMAGDVSGQTNPNLIKLYPISGANPLQGTYTQSDSGDVGTYYAGMTANYDGFNYDWTTNGDGGDDLKIELIYEDPNNSENNIYDISLSSYILNYGNWDFSNFNWVSEGTKQFSLYYRGKIDRSQ